MWTFECIIKCWVSIMFLCLGSTQSSNTLKQPVQSHNFFFHCAGDIFDDHMGKGLHPALEGEWHSSLCIHIVSSFPIQWPHPYSLLKKILKFTWALPEKVLASLGKKHAKTVLIINLYWQSQNSFQTSDSTLICQLWHSWKFCREFEGKFGSVDISNLCGPKSLLPNSV